MSTPWLAVLFLHLLAVAFFIGGQLMLALVIVPAERSNPDQERTRAMARRFGVGSLIALGVLIATGAAMASEFGLWDNGTLHVKLALVVAVVALVLAHTRLPRTHALSAVILLLSLAIVWLGLELTR